MSHWGNFFLKTNCALCQRSTHQPLCLACERQLQQCRIWPIPQGQKQTPSVTGVGGLSVFAWGEYRDAVKRTIAALKYEGNRDLAAILADYLVASWLEAPHPNYLTIVPVPIHPSKREERGFNQADLLACHFCHLTGYPLAVNGLERIKTTVAQFQVGSAQEREANLKDAFALGRTFQTQRPRHPVLLIDDIYTSGATVRSAAQTLRRHGIRVYGVAVVAQAGRSHQR